MKTRILVLMLCVGFAQGAFAQLTLGIKGGVNITKIDGKSFSDEFRYGYHLGGFADIKLGKKFGIQPEVLFNQYNTRTDTSFAAVYSTENLSNLKDVKLNYLTIPILLNYRLANVLTLQAGPQVGILLSQDKGLVTSGKEAFKSGEFSMVGGATINLSKLRLTGRYMVGLNNVSDIQDQNKWKNQGFQLSLGLAL